MSKRRERSDGPEERALDSLVAWLDELDVGRSDSPPHPTPPLSSTASSTIDDDDHDRTSARRLSAAPVRGFICSYRPGDLEGTIKARSGTHYAFEKPDLLKIDRLHLRCGWPVQFEPTASGACLRAERVRIDWTDVLVRTSLLAWHGPRIPFDQLTVEGRCTRWTPGQASGQVEFGSTAFRTSFNLRHVPIDTVDRACIRADWPISLDLTRDKSLASDSFRAASIRLDWRGVIALLAEAISTDGLRDLAETMGRLRPASDRVIRGLRPCAATITLLPDSAVDEPGQLRFVGQEKWPVDWTATTSWPRGVRPALGERVYAWRVSGRDGALVLLVPRPEGVALVFSC